MALHDSLHLYVCPDAYAFEPVFLDPSVPSETLVVYRDTAEIKVNAPYSLRHDEVLTIFGIVGMIRLNGGEHLIVITDRIKMGKIGNHDIYKMSAYRILPLARDRSLLTETQIYDDNQYLAMLEEMLGLDGFYFSPSFHMTHTLQRQGNLKTDGKGIWAVADDRFFFNRYLHSRFIETSVADRDLSRFIMPIICGFVEIRPAVINGKRLTFALVSRRSRYRVGTRYFSRGIDHEGRVSNYVETEQIVILDADPMRGHMFSYIQTRGSIPVFWQQVVNLKYTPKMVIENNPDAERVIRKHFEEQIDVYGKQIAVNLINKKGSEMRLGDVYTGLLKSLNDLEIVYNWFDFHHECRNMKWHRISILLDQLENHLNEQGYTHIDDKGRQLSLQTSVVRTNCMDCLDRTNVLQSVLGRRALTQQLRAAGYLSPKERVEEQIAFEFLYKNMWADHADAISSQYSGTGALKTDFTRTGRRTKRGLLQDFVNSSVRYFKANFTDGARQDGFDLFTGAYEVKAGAPSPFLTESRTWRYKVLPYVALFCFIMFIGGLMIQPADASSHRLFLIGFGAVFALSMYDIIRHGTEFADLPHLGSASELVTRTGARTNILSPNGDGVELKASKEA